MNRPTETARIELSTDQFGSSISNVIDDDGEHVTVENVEFFLDHPLSMAVRKELRDFVDISDADIAWIVEATLWQLQRLATQGGAVDLDYLGKMTSINAIGCRGAGRKRFLVWQPRPAVEAMRRVTGEGEHGYGPNSVDPADRQEVVQG